MSLNELIKFAKMHDIDFNKDIICVSQVDGEIYLDNLEQMKEINLWLFPLCILMMRI